MDMDALGSAIEHVAKASITSDAAAASPMVTKLLTSAKIIHRLHSARSMNDWDTMSEGMSFVFFFFFFFSFFINFLTFLFFFILKLSWTLIQKMKKVI